MWCSGGDGDSSARPYRPAWTKERCWHHARHSAPAGLHPDGLAKVVSLLDFKRAREQAGPEGR